jgi:putative ABC transport system permease protein
VVTGRRRGRRVGPGAGFWLRWSLRDLRARAFLIVAVALVVGLGLGLYAGLGATAAWRRHSNDASYERLHAHDVRVHLEAGVDVAEGDLLAALEGLPDPDRIATAAERLVDAVPVDASTDGRTILVAGRIVGSGDATGGPIDELDVRGGRLPVARSDPPEVALEFHFAEHHELADSTPVALAAGVRATSVGQVLAPEYFLVTGLERGLFSQSSFAVVFAPLETAQEILGRPGRVNDVVLGVRPGVPPAAVKADLEARLPELLPDVAASVTLLTEDDGYRLLYDDIDGDQRVWNLVAGLVLLGAVVAAFNLTSRMVDQQRRELGIGLALGVPPSRLARRPLMVGAWIAALGIVFGIAVGLAVDAALAGVYRRLLPLPVWDTSFQAGRFLRAAALGAALPLLAVAWPVWRAVRVPPVEAIRPALLGRSHGWAATAARVPLPGSALAQMPWRNLMRNPRRTALTVAGVAAVITTLVGTFGMFDTFLATIDRGEREALKDHPDRLVVQLTQFVPASSPAFTTLAESPSIGAAEPGVTLQGRITAGTRRVDSLLAQFDAASTIWRPTVDDPAPATGDRPGIVLSRKAAEDLHVRPGDTVRVTHPALLADGARTVDTEFAVVGVHPSPLRSLAYVPAADADVFGTAGLANTLTAVPAPGATVEQVERSLFGRPYVASFEPISQITQTTRDLVQQFLDVLRIAQVMILGLAVLIALNTATISVEERAREHATMIAFGVTPARVLRMLTVEGLVVGVLGTLAGLGLGYGFLHWTVHSVLSETLPDVSLVPRISGTTVLTTLGLGVLAVGSAPLLTVRRIRRIDLPSRLRVVE